MAPDDHVGTFTVADLIFDDASNDVGEVSQPRPSEQVVTRTVRYRTVGDMSCTGAVESDAANVADVLAEVAATRITERGATRADDRLTEAAMEDRKKEGYF